MTEPTDLAVLRALVEAGRKATPGEWRFDPIENSACDDGCHIDGTIRATKFGVPIELAGKRRDRGTLRDGREIAVMWSVHPYSNERGDGPFIALAANARPALERLAAGVADQRDFLNRALGELLNHRCDHDCGEDCGCSVGEAKSLLRAAIKALGSL